MGMRGSLDSKGGQMTEAELEGLSPHQAQALATLEQGGMLTPVGLTLPDTITQQQFAQIALALGSMRESLHWAIGDLIVTGEKLFGEESYQLFESLNISEVSRQQYIRVGLRIALERRRVELSWSHHRAVTPLEVEDQDRFLESAVANNWTKSELEDAIKKEFKGQLPPPPGKMGYIAEAVAEAAEKVWESAMPNLKDPDTYIVPQGPMKELGHALGEHDQK